MPMSMPTADAKCQDTQGTIVDRLECGDVGAEVLEVKGERCNKNKMRVIDSQSHPLVSSVVLGDVPRPVSVRWVE